MPGPVRRQGGIDSLHVPPLGHAFPGAGTLCSEGHMAGGRGDRTEMGGAEGVCSAWRVRGGQTLSAAGCGAGGLWEGFLGDRGGLGRLRTPLLPPHPCVDLGSLWEDSRNGSCSDKNRLLRRAWGLASCSRCPPGLARVGPQARGGARVAGAGSAACAARSLSWVQYQRARRETFIIYGCRHSLGSWKQLAQKSFLPEGQGWQEEGLCSSAKLSPSHGSSTSWLGDLGKSLNLSDLLCFINTMWLMCLVRGMQRQRGQTPRMWSRWEAGGGGVRRCWPEARRDGQATWLGASGPVGGLLRGLPACSSACRCEEVRVTGMADALWVYERGEPRRGPCSGLGPCQHTPLPPGPAALTADCRGQAGWELGSEPGSQQGEASWDPVCWGIYSPCPTSSEGAWAGRGRYSIDCDARLHS